MSCGGRIYKGGMTTVSVPFNVEGYSNLSISYFTSGDYKITKTEDDLVIEDGFITYTFTKEELDVMPDGVLNYLVNYEVEGGKYADGGNTNVYLKTPQDYSATSVTEMVQSAYTEGHEIGYEEGHAQGKQEGEEVGYNEAVSVIRNQSISLSVSANGVYTANTEDSIYFSEVNVNVPQGSGGTCNLQAGELNIDTGWTGSEIVTPSQGYDGFSSFEVSDNGYGQAKYAEGYAAGQASCPECSGGSSCNLENGEILIFDTFENGDVFYPSNGYDGFSSVTIYDKNYSETWFNSGYTEGYYAAWLYYPSDVFCRLDTGVNIGGTYSVDLHRNNDTHIVNPNYRNEFIILGNSSDNDNCYMQLSLTDDNIIRLILDDTETTSVLSAQTYGEYIHADIIFNESESSVTLNVINHGYNGSMAISLSASGFDWIMQDMAQELVINGAYNDGESEYHPELYPPYFNVATCNIMIDKIVAYDNYGNMEHLWKYKNGCLADCMTNNQHSFLRCVYHSDFRYWSQDPVEIMGTPLGMGGV